jgi:hypothetical protein
VGIYPEVARFTAAPEAVRAGDPVTLSWETRGTAAIRLEAVRESGTEVLRGLPPAGSITIQPRETTTWRIRCETAFSGLMCNPAVVAQIEVKPAPPHIIESGFGGSR